MASLKDISLFALCLPLLFLQAALVKGAVNCEDLGKENCSFAVSSTGNRCILDKTLTRGGMVLYTCRTSSIEVEGALKGMVESEQCINDCGLQRSMLGISSDSLYDLNFFNKMCSPLCYTLCPNIVDLFFNLAADEGVFLPTLCKSQKGGRRRMTETDEIMKAQSPGNLEAEMFASDGEADDYPY